MYYQKGMPTIFCMLIVVCKMTNMNIKINRLMVGRLVGETEAMHSLPVRHKLEFLACFVMKVLNLLTTRAPHLIFFKCNKFRVPFFLTFGEDLL